MPLRFPDFDDVPLGRAPLREVICQVKFPLILRVAEEQPVGFQEQIRERFPDLDVDRTLRVQIGESEDGRTMEFRPSAYRFYTRGRTFQVALAPDFYAVSTKVYQHWEEFADYLRYADAAVRAEYEIPFATRIGLRYINVIDAKLTDSGRIQEAYDLVRPQLTTMLRTEVMLSPVHAIQEIRIADDDYHFKLRHGLAPWGESRELGFVLDFDCYSEGEIDLDGLVERCERYHDVIYNAFRWCIREGELPAEFEPRPPAERECNHEHS